MKKINKKIILFHLGEVIRDIGQIISNLSKEHAYENTDRKWKVNWRADLKNADNTKEALLIRLQHIIKHLNQLTYQYTKTDEEIMNESDKTVERQRKRPKKI